MRTLVVVLSGLFMSVLDFFIVNVAIPSIQGDLHASASVIELVVAAYALAYGAVLITGGRMGDIFGRRRVFILAMTAFTVSSTVCGIAPSAAVLVAARALQGLSAGFMAPQVLAILSTAYSSEARARAINAYGMTMGVAAVFGQLIGGLLIRLNLFGLDWRLCFLVNLPIGAAALLLGAGRLPESRASIRPRLDAGGMLLVTAALLAVVLPLIEGRQEGWPAWAWASLAASAALFAVLAVHQRRSAALGGSPLIDPDLFREKAFRYGLLAQLVFWMGQASYFLIFALYMQEGRGLDALGAGTIFAAIGAGYMVSSSLARVTARRLGSQVIAVGGVLRVVGLALQLLAVSRMGPVGSLAPLIPGLVIDGAGMGFAIAPLAGTVLARIRPEHAGAASGILTTGIQVGNALGVSLIGLLFYGSLARGGYGRAFSVSLLFLIGVGLTVALLAQLLPRSTRLSERP